MKSLIRILILGSFCSLLPGCLPDQLVEAYRGKYQGVTLSGQKCEVNVTSTPAVFCLLPAIYIKTFTQAGDVTDGKSESKENFNTDRRSWGHCSSFTWANIEFVEGTKKDPRRILVNKIIEFAVDAWKNLTEVHFKDKDVSCIQLSRQSK